MVSFCMPLLVSLVDVGFKNGVLPLVAMEAACLQVLFWIFILDIPSYSMLEIQIPSHMQSQIHATSFLAQKPIFQSQGLGLGHATLCLHFAGDRQHVFVVVWAILLVQRWHWKKRFDVIHVLTSKAFWRQKVFDVKLFWRRSIVWRQTFFDVNNFFGVNNFLTSIYFLASAICLTSKAFLTSTNVLTSKIFWRQSET